MSDTTAGKTVYTATHWGAYKAEVENQRLKAIHPFEKDLDPSPIGQSLVDTLDDACRIRQPMVRAGFLEHGPQRPCRTRGAEPFVAVEWQQALDLVAAELQRVRASFGNPSIFAGSYGWASAGRFHHAQSQMRRFLNLLGGFTYSVHAYSYAAAEVIMPHVVGNFFWLLSETSSWDGIAANSDLFVAFGGLPLKNSQVDPGGMGSHSTAYWLQRCRERGVRFVNISPLRSDTADYLGAEWHRLRPGTDTALMLGLAHTLVSENLHDRRFLARYCTGFDKFLPYLTGAADAQPKDAGWAAAICGLSADTIRQLARRMAAQRTMIALSWSLQRGDHGEQPYWMAVTLAAMLGQIGLPGGGFGCGYSATNGIGQPASPVNWAALPQGQNPVGDFIPVARISDLLLHPGDTIDYDGRRLTLPDIRLIYWVGGNPFHHHQDINRLLRAWQQPETIIVHERWWNSLARHADIVLPATTSLERNDVAFNKRDGFAIAMQQALPALAQARNDHDIFADLAGRFEIREAFTEERSEMDWLRYIYNVSRQRAAEAAIELPDFETFWRQGYLELPPPQQPRVLLAGFRDDPEKYPLRTPSGKIEIFSETIAGFAYDDCPAHPVWLEPLEWLGSPKAKQYPLHLISNQPKTRLHSQLDNGSVSRAGKIRGREPMLINPQDAAARAIEDGAVVRVFNDRGACLAGVSVSDEVRPGVVALATGAWYDPLEPGVPGTLDKHGNANMLTPDKGTSKLAQAPIAHSTLVEVERFDDELPPVTVFAAPPVLNR